MSLIYQPFPLSSRRRKSDRGGIITWRNRFDELDREDGPALVRRRSFRQNLLKEGLYLAHKEYYRCGRRHRTDGPAVVYDPRDALLWQTPLWEFWRDGVLHRTDGPARVFLRGAEWYRHGQLHREGGPAIMRPPSGTLRPLYEYYYEGQLHREDGPAVIYPDHKESDVPLEEYWLHGELTRDDGPVIVWSNGESWNRHPTWHRSESSS